MSKISTCRKLRAPTKPVLSASIIICVMSVNSLVAVADEALLRTHCGKCHSGEEPEGDFDVRMLGESPSAESIGYWTDSIDYVKSGDMPPADESRLSDSARRRLVAFLRRKVRRYDTESKSVTRVAPRRLNNRELANSVRDALMIEDVGAHDPTANLLGDTLKDGFDTDGESLGISEFHLEQYINAFRKIVDATILSGPMPPPQLYEVTSDDLRMTSRSQRNREERANRTVDSIDILDVRLRAYFANFKTVPATGRYRIKIRAKGVDRRVYDENETGVYDGDPIRLRVHLGSRTRDFDLADDEVTEIELDEWLAEGTPVELSYLTDGLRMRGNGNFKFQYSIAHDYIKQHDPQLYYKVVTEVVPKSKFRNTNPAHWSHWTEYWQGPRPRIFDAEVEGPIYESWPPKRHTALLGENAGVERADTILAPIARRAWAPRVARWRTRSDRPDGPIEGRGTRRDRGDEGRNRRDPLFACLLADQSGTGTADGTFRGQARLLLGQYPAGRRAAGGVTRGPARFIRRCAGRDQPPY